MFIISILHLEICDLSLDQFVSSEKNHIRLRIAPNVAGTPLSNYDINFAEFPKHWKVSLFRVGLLRLGHIGRKYYRYSVGQKY